MKMNIAKHLLFTFLLLQRPAYAGNASKLPAAEAFTPVNRNFDQGSYIAIPLKSEAFAATLVDAEAAAGSKLKNRVEAHMTVVTPPEMKLLAGPERAKFLAQLNALDWTQKVITPVCLGRGFAVLGGQKESAYFIVVESPAVSDLREKFGLSHFRPHVTLGFSKRDLHFEDGVIKDRTSCI